MPRRIRIAGAAILGAASFYLIYSGAEWMLVAWAAVCVAAFAATLSMLWSPLRTLVASVHWESAPGTALGGAQYEYWVKGRRYRSMRRHFGPSPAGQSTLPDQLTVWYDPRNPEDSVIERRVDLARPVQLVLLLCAAGIVVLWRLGLLR